MKMAGRLTDAGEVATLVSDVTQAMCGTSFVPWDPLARGESLSGRMVVLELKGERRIKIALASDGSGSRALAAATFGCSPAEVTPARIDDAIRELLNVIAGQVQRRLNINQSLGMPRPTTLAELQGDGGPGTLDAVLLRSQGRIDVRLWIFEEVAPGDPIEAAKPRGFRSLIRRLVPNR